MAGIISNAITPPPPVDMAKSDALWKSIDVDPTGLAPQAGFNPQDPNAQAAALNEYNASLKNPDGTYKTNPDGSAMRFSDQRDAYYAAIGVDPNVNTFISQMQQAGMTGKEFNKPAATPAPGGGAGGGIVAGASRLGDPTKWNVTPDQTVEGRIQAIIGSGSPLMQAAETRSLEEMNTRGIANSSIAVGAGQKALYDAAMPIAQADAATFAKSAGYNADMSNQFAVRNVDYSNQWDLAKLNTDTQKSIAGMNIEAQALANKLQQDNQTLLQTNSHAAQSFNTAMSAINNIQMNNQMDAETKTKAIAQVWADVQNQLKVLGGVAGLNLASQLNFANMPGFDATGKYIGFPDDAEDDPAGPNVPGGNDGLIIDGGS